MRRDDARELLSRSASIEALASARVEHSALDGPYYVGQVFYGPNAAAAPPAVWLTHPLHYSGPLAEGVVPASDVDGSLIVPVVFFDRKPNAGDNVIASYVMPEGRWVAERLRTFGYTGGTGTMPNCFCNPIPATLTMTSSSSTCNYGMFQSCSIVYGPTPAGYADLDLGANSFLSSESFPDVIANGAMFQYLLTCQYNQFNLSRVYLNSPYGSPYRDGILFTWVLGSYGNTCVPFHLDNGISFAGSDADCFVTIDE